MEHERNKRAKENSVFLFLSSTKVRHKMSESTWKLERYKKDEGRNHPFTLIYQVNTMECKGVRKKEGVCEVEDIRD